jgi:disulfide bond formation protein DsbB
MTWVQTVSKLLSTLTFVSDIIIAIFIIFALYSLSGGKIPKSINNIWKVIKKNYLIFALIVALTATLGSLFYSEIAKYTPCELCGYQRILMYPQVLLLAIALFKKDNKIGQYVIPMSIVGGVIAAYHYFVQISEVATSCGIDAVSCSSKYTFQYEYITIPIMALTAFILIIILTYNSKK